MKKLTKEKIQEINSNRKPTEGFTEQDFINANQRAKHFKKLLWLDDIRNPFLDNEGKVGSIKEIHHAIHWVLNYDQFVEYINKFGLPDIISFDHDIGEDQYTPEEYWDDYEKSKAYQEAQTYQDKTGMDCAKYLVEYCMDNNLELPVFYVHSANPVGADNIRGLLTNFKKHYEKS